MYRSQLCPVAAAASAAAAAEERHWLHSSLDARCESGPQMEKATSRTKDRIKESATLANIDLKLI